MTQKATVITFSLNNPNAPNTIYISGTASDNKLTLVINVTAGTTFAAGTPVSPDKAGSATGSIFYLDLTPLPLTADEFNGLSLDKQSNWASQPWVQDNNMLFAFAPIADVQLADNGSVSLTFDNFTMAATPGSASASLALLAYRVPGFASGTLPGMTSTLVGFAQPPAGKAPLQNSLSATITPLGVVNSIDGQPEVENTLTLMLSAVPGGSSVPATSKTVFTLSFVYAKDTNGFGALLDIDEGQKITIPPPDGTSWGTSNVDGTDGRSWTLQPPVGDSILGSNNTPVAFTINPVITHFQPGPTVALLTYSGVTGFADGSFPIPILKQPHVAIGSFKVDPPVSTLIDGNASVTLSWTATDFEKLTLQPFGADVTKTKPPTYQATIQDTQSFCLVAEGVRPGNVDNTASWPLVAQVLPQINSFVATPSAIHVSDFPFQTKLAWNVNTNEQVTLTSSTTGVFPTNFNPATSVQAPIASPQLLTLAPVGVSGGIKVNRKLYLAGFDTSAAQVGIGSNAAFAAIPSNAGFIAVSLPSQNKIAILSTANFLPYTTIGVGSNPLGLAFSRDGHTLFVANSGDGTVSVFGVSPAAQQPPFTFQPIATISVGGSPQSVVVGPDGRAWVSVDLGTGTNGVVAMLTPAGGTYTASTVTVGQAPRGIAIHPSGGVVYVANRDSNSVSLLTVGSGVPAPGSSVPNITAPLDVAVTPEGGNLLVASSGDGAVYVYNTQSLFSTPRVTIALPGAARLGLFPGGGYALVTSTSPNQAVLINYADKPPATLKTVPLAAAPLGVAIAPDNGFAIVALDGAGGVQEITFAQYEQTSTTTALAGSPTSILIAPDNQTAIAWYNATLNAAVLGGVTPLTGVVKSSISAGGQQPYLAGTKIVAAAISPIAADDALYLAPLGQSQLSAYHLSSMATLATLPIKPLGGFDKRQPVALGLSQDGTRLFALVSDGKHQFSVVVFAANPTTATFTQLADVVLYTGKTTPLALPFAVAADGSAAYAVDATTGNLWQVQASGQTYTVSATPLSIAQAGTYPITMAISPDATTAYILLETGIVNAIAVVALPQWTANTITLPDPTTTMQITALVVSPDGDTLFGCDQAIAGIRVIDAASLRIKQTMWWSNGVQGPYGIAVASDGSGIVAANLTSANLAIAQQVQPSIARQLRAA